MQSDYHREHNVDPNEALRPRYTILEMLSMSDERIREMGENELMGIFEALGLDPTRGRKICALKQFEKFNRYDCADIKDKQAQCTICLDLVTEPQSASEDQPPIDTKVSRIIVKTPCNHLFHYKCAKMWYEQSKTCPHCRSEIKSDQDLEEEIRAANLEELHDSMFS